MNRQALLNFREAMFNEVAHAATAMIEERVCSPQLAAAVNYFATAHEAACRELAIGKPAMAVQRLKEAMQIARIHLERGIGKVVHHGTDLHDALAILKNALAEEEGHV